MGLRGAALLAIALSALAGALPAAARQAPDQVVHYSGVRLLVPASWPVFHLDEGAPACVRFDRHAVYLGRPTGDEGCPAHAAGRTEAILVDPAASAGLPAEDGGGAGSVNVAVPRRGVVIVASWGGDRPVIDRALGYDSEVRAAWRSTAPSSRAASLAFEARPGPAADGAGATGTADAAWSGDLARAGARGRAGDLARVGARGRAGDLARVGARARAARVFSGLGFDACSAPSPAQMADWMASPYRAIGVYVGGVNMACAQPNLSSAWTGHETRAGWHLVPTYVGLQAPGNSCRCAAVTPARAAAAGSAEAKDAVARASVLGIGPGNPIYYDMEAYPVGGASSRAALGLLSAWTAELHSLGYLSGVYSSADSGIRDLVDARGTGFIEPDDVWVADWNGVPADTGGVLPAADWGGRSAAASVHG